VILGALAATVIQPGAVLGQATYEAGKTYWLRGVYQSAYDTLLDYRQQSFARKPEVDYMIGTSACRLDCCRAWGGRLLGTLPESYALTPESRRLIDSERNLCQQTASLPAPVADGPDKLRRMIAAGVSGRAKVFSTPDSSVGVTTYPARRVRDISAAELQRRLIPRSDPTRAVATATAIAGTSNVAVYRRFVITSQSSHSRRQLDEIGATLEKFLEFLTERYGMTLPDQFVTIHLVPTPDSLRQTALRLHGLDVTPGTIGYAFQEDLSIVAFVTGTGVGTVLHEMVHLSVRARFGDIPQWLDEGLAGLYEVSTMYPDGVYGEPNWRGDVLKALWHRRPKIGALITTPWFPVDVPEMTNRNPNVESPQGEDLVAFMATARYFCLFLERKGHLTAVYRAVRDRDFTVPVAPSEAARLALEQAFEKSATQIDGEFADWFMAGVPTTAKVRQSSGAVR
jgi:hypothetical protein